MQGRLLAGTGSFHVGGIEAPLPLREGRLRASPSSPDSVKRPCLPESRTEVSFERVHRQFDRPPSGLRAVRRMIISGNESMPSRGGSLVIRAVPTLIERVRGRCGHGSSVECDTDSFVESDLDVRRCGRGLRKRRAVLCERPRQYPGMRRGKGRAHDHQVFSEPPQGADFNGTAEGRSSPSERDGILGRQQDDSYLIRREQIRETPAGSSPGDPGAGLGEVRLQERLDLLRLRVTRRVLTRGADHEVALAIDLPLAVRGVGQKRLTRNEQRRAGEGGGEEGAPAGAPSRDDGALSCGTCRTHRGSGRPSRCSSGRPRPDPRAGRPQRWPGCTPARS